MNFQIEVGEITTVKGSTVKSDGSVGEWERPAVAYYPATIDSYLDGAPEKDAATALYLFQRHGGN